MTRAEDDYGTITKQIHIDAAPPVVYDVISSPDHIARWWTDEADFESVPGGSGTLAWRAGADTAREEDYVVRLSVVEAVPAERFVFRWIYPDGEAPTAANSMLVTFTLRPDGGGTLLTLTEEGMREQGWDAVALEEYYISHDDGWTRHLANLSVYVTNLARNSRP